MTCECGEPVYIRKTGECKRCYHRRYKPQWWDKQLAAQGKTRRVKASRPLRPEGRPLLPLLDLHRPLSYLNAHRRIYVWRGKASLHPCTSCGAPAQSWSYRGGGRHDRTAEKQNPHGSTITVHYSTDPRDYDPLCFSCHSRRDRSV